MIGPNNGCNGRNHQYDGEVVEVEEGENLAADQGRNNSHQHAPEKAGAIESPPVPFQHIADHIGALEGRHNPLKHAVHIQGKKSEDHRNGHHHDSCEVVGSAHLFSRGIGL